ncbi:hypothetical protein BDN67DRAFT_710300 [Paxillus ammoniavirescens]|nr:hypothetical protein BDN67DRAFT_710300 [Paxillus ammoniavirescens]
MTRSSPQIPLYSQVPQADSATASTTPTFPMPTYPSWPGTTSELKLARAVSSGDPHVAIPNLPDHWTVQVCQLGHPLSYIRALSWAMLCLSSVSKPDLEESWISLQTDELWQKQGDMFVLRISNSNTAAGLILATTAVLMTTVPPTNTWNYLEQFPYSLCTLALCHSLMSIWFGSWLIIVYQSTTRRWALDVLTKNRFRLIWTLLLMSLPTSNFLFSAFCLLHAIAVVTASSPKTIFQAGVGIELGLWWICSVVGLFCLISPTFWTVTVASFFRGKK